MPRNDDGRVRRAATTAQPSAVGLVECAVRVSPSLARRIRKIAELEASGVGIAAALLAAAGVPAGRIEALEAQIADQASALAERDREVADRDRTIERGKAALKERDTELTALRRAQGSATQELAAAQREREAAGKRGEEAAATIAGLRAELAASQSLAGLDEAAVAALRDLAERLRGGGTPHAAALGIAGYRLEEIDEALVQHRRADLRAAETLLAGGGWRAGLLRWLLGGASGG